MTTGFMARKLRPDTSDTPIMVVFTVGVTACIISSFATPLATPFLMAVLALALLFLPQFMELLVILLPMALMNPRLRVGAEGMVVSDVRSFHPINVNMTELFVGAIFLAWLTRGRNREGERAGSFLNVPTFGLALMALMGIFFAHNTSSGAKIAFERFWVPLVVFFVVSHIRWDRAKLRRALGVMALSAGAVALLSAWGYYHTAGMGAQAEHFERMTSDWGAVNILAAFFTLLMPYAFLRSFYLGTKKTRLWYMILFGCLSFALAITFSRTAWVSLAVVLLILCFRYRKTWPFLVFGAMVVAVFGTADMLDRARTLASVSEDHSFIARTTVWKNSAIMALKSPFWGIGHGTFEQVYRDEFQNVHPHNDYLHLAVAMGIAATIFYVMILIRVLRSVSQASSVTNDQADRIVLAALGAGFATTVVESFFASLMTYGAFALLLWYMLGVAAGYSRSVIMDHEEQTAAADSLTEVPAGSAPP